MEINLVFWSFFFLFIKIFKVQESDSYLDAHMFLFFKILEYLFAHCQNNYTEIFEVLQNIFHYILVFCFIMVEYDHRNFNQHNSESLINLEIIIFWYFLETYFWPILKVLNHYSTFLKLDLYPNMLGFSMMDFLANLLN